MDTPRNKGRAPGMTVLGVPMSKTLKDQIKAAADINRRTMADWARKQGLAGTSVFKDFLPVIRW